MVRQMVLTGLPLTPSKLITFFDADTHTVLFSHNDALVVTRHIENYRVSKILVDTRSSLYILYGGALYRMEETPGMAQAMINLQTRSHLYGLTVTRLTRCHIIASGSGL